MIAKISNMAKFVAPVNAWSFIFRETIHRLNSYLFSCITKRKAKRKTFSSTRITMIMGNAAGDALLDANIIIIMVCSIVR